MAHRWVDGHLLILTHAVQQMPIRTVQRMLLRHAHALNAGLSNRGSTACAGMPAGRGLHVAQFKKEASKEAGPLPGYETAGKSPEVGCSRFIPPACSATKLQFP
jgi:hypothetical protein